MEDKPDYISQTGATGEFKLAGLSEGLYRVFAVQDEFRDLIFNVDQDKYGAPSKDVYLSNDDSLITGLNFFLSSTDTTEPRILSASMTDKFHILVNFSEEFDSSIISANNFFLFDSSLNKRENVLYAFKGNTKPSELVLVVKADLKTENTIYLFADTLKDLRENIFRNDFTPVTINEAPDTAKPFIFKITPALSDNRADYQNQSFTFSFNDAFDISIAKTGITFTDTVGREVNFNIYFPDDATVIIQTVKNLERQKDYLIKIDFKKFQDAAGNFFDSVYTYKFKTISGLDFTGLTGYLQNVDQHKNPLLILQQVEADKTKYIIKPASTGKFSFDRIEPGKYILWSYLDKDSSGSFNYGYPFPFQPAEEFSFYPDTLLLRARWTQTDLFFNFLWQVNQNVKTGDK
jgi:hypothetical protein